MKRYRTLLTAAAPLALLATLLTGCTSGGGAITVDASGTDCVASGSASQAIKVDGDLGSQITLTSATPASAEEMQRSVLIEGGSTPFAESANVEFALTIFDGKTGELVNFVPRDKAPNEESQFKGAEWAYEAVRCGSVGQRVALVVPAGEALGGDPATAGFDLSADDTFVMVMDFMEPYTQFGDCDALKPRDEKFPEVDLGDGTTEPKITIPECMEAPTEVEITVLKEGSGEVVESGQAVMTNYFGVKWNGAERFDGSWSETGIRFSTAPGSLIDGFTQAMVGQKIGSVILVSMPPEAAYGVGTGHALADTTLTFVLELVSITQ